MRSLFDHWKYIVKNLWFVLPFAVTPAVFLALSVDFAGIQSLAASFFTGKLEVDFLALFHAWSFFRFDSFLGVIYSIFAVIAIVVFTTFLLSFAEKHMRIGKRTLSGVFSQFADKMFYVTLVTLVYLLLYELWALVLSAVLFAVAAVGSKIFMSVLFVIVCLVFIGTLLYLVPVFYLWLPCIFCTGFGAYDAFLYSYRLMGGVRWKLILSLLIEYVPCFILIVGISFAPTWLSPIIAFIMYVFAYLSFCIRMETLYFETDKLDREDFLRSYREL